MSKTIAQPERFLLGRGSRKLRSRIFTFSLPAISTCPGKSQLCREACYATKGQLGMKSNNFNQRRIASRRKGFVRRIVREIQQRYARIVRIHVSGDFYSALYVRKWIQIARACPDTRFFAYTRSWRVSEMSADLVKLSRLKNVRLWYSCDQETGMPEKVPKRVRVAYMSMSDEDSPGQGSDLVFRVRRDTVKKRMSGVLVCPTENGVTHVQCETCQLCSYPEKNDPRRFALPMVAA